MLRGLSRDQRRFVIYLAALGALVFAGYRESVLALPLADLCALTAQAAFSVIQVLGIPAALDGTVISHPGGFACEVMFRCTGFLPVVCLVVAVWASPGTGRHKLAGIGTGVPLLLVLNLVRIVHVYVIGVTRPALFDLVHGVIWEAVIVAAVTGIWLAWLFATTARRRHREHSKGLCIVPN